MSSDNPPDQYPDQLHVAISCEDAAQVLQLLESGWPVNKPNQFGEPPLWQAAVNGQDPMVRILLDHGGDVDLPNADRETAILAAFLQFKPTTVSALISRSADTSCLGTPGAVKLALAAMSGDIQQIADSVRSGQDVNSRVTRGRTPLICAVGADQPESVRVLIELGADVEQVEDPEMFMGEQHEGDTPLSYAASYASLDVVAMLLAAGADPNHAYDDGRTPLTDAAMNCDTPKIELLLAHGAYVHGAL
jgi:ankyrin repeat protein